MTTGEIISRFPDAKKSGNGWIVKCPVPSHQDGTPSLSISPGKDGRTVINCFGGCDTEAVCRAVGLSLSDLFIHKAAVPPFKMNYPQTLLAFDWSACVMAFTDAEAQRLADWRGISQEFFKWLHAQGAVGLYESKPAFPVHRDGKVVACHCRLDNGKWMFFPRGENVAPLIFGDLHRVGHVLAFESQWDCFAVMDRLGAHVGDGLPDTAFIVTRGAGNAKLIRGQVSPDAVSYAFTQNDSAGGKWLGDIAANAGCTVLNVTTPAPHKDCNDWLKAGAGKSGIEAAMKQAKSVCVPERTPEAATKILVQDGDIRGEIISILTNLKLSPAEQHAQVADAVVRALSQRGRFFFHAERRDFDSAMFFDGERKRLERIRSDSFLAWLSDWLRVNRASTAFRYVVAQTETVALSGEQTIGILPESFWASRLGAIYLSNGDGSIVRITPGKIETVDNGTDGVLFSAGNTLAAWTLTEPQDPFSTCSLFGGANYAAKHGLDLSRVWLFSLPTNPPCKPPLCPAGNVGSGKTRFAKGAAEFYGLPFVANKTEEQGEDSFWASLDNGGLFILDNADTRVKWLPDAVASAATDGCSQRRKKYKDSELVTLRARAWLCVTSANPTFASDAGLADRLLVVRMNRRTDETSDAKLSAEILEHRDAGLSFIAHALATALADTRPTPAGLNQRHPDWGAFAVRIGRAIGRETETVAALRTAETDKSAFCIENDSVGAALLAHLQSAGEFSGTAKELREKLIEADNELAEKLSAKRLGKRLSALWPHLEKVLHSKQEKDRNHFTIYTLKANSADYAEYQTAF